MTDRRGFLRRSVLAAGTLGVRGVESLGRSSVVLEDPAAPVSALRGVSALPLVPDVDAARWLAHVQDLLAATKLHGVPLEAEQVRALRAAIERADADGRADTAAVQQVLDRSCLADVHINPEMRVKLARGPAPALLLDGRWCLFLVKVRNEAGITARLRGTSPQARREGAPARHDAHQWLDLTIADARPLPATLSGSALEYRVLQLYSHERGQREATLVFDVGQGTQDLGFRNELPILFACSPR